MALGLWGVATKPVVDEGRELCGSEEGSYCIYCSSWSTSRKRRQGAEAATAASYAVNCFDGKLPVEFIQTKRVQTFGAATS